MSNQSVAEFSQGKEITIADLYPDLTTEQQSEAEYRLLGYLAITKRIFEQICTEEPGILTELEMRARVREESSDNS